MTDYILSFIQTYSDWAMLIVFLIALIESLLIIGLFLPGWLLLVGIGGLIGADVLSFYPIVIAAYLGAVIGEYISFLLGYHYHQKILQWPMLARHQKLIRYSHNFFQQYGVGGVFVARFFGPTRSVVPFIAGVCEMPKKTFFWVNCLSGLLWAPLYLIPGILIGAAFNLDKQQSHYLLLTLLVIGLGFVLIMKFNKPIFNRNRDQNSILMMFKAVLSWCITACMILIFVRSSLWQLFCDILLVVWNKI